MNRLLIYNMRVTECRCDLILFLRLIASLNDTFSVSHDLLYVPLKVPLFAASVRGEVGLLTKITAWSSGLSRGTGVQ